jgi:predicted esterase
MRMLIEPTRATLRRDMTDRLRVQFIHGLEGSPQGAKARFLAEHFEACTLAMDTRDFAGCVDAQARALAETGPDVVVGSSFGGAVAVELLARGAWRGPTLLLAQAALKLGRTRVLPVGVPVILVHGLRDDVVAIDDSRALAATGSARLVKLIEVDDDHRLQTLLDSGRLANLVREVVSLAKA